MNPMSNVAEIFDTMSYGPAPEADTAARDWLAAHSARFGLFINGAWVQPQDGDAFLDSRNPATGETLARIAVAGPKDVDAAVAAAAVNFNGDRLFYGVLALLSAILLPFTSRNSRRIQRNVALLTERPI